MDSTADQKNRKLWVGALLLALGVGAGLTYWIGDNYDVRIVRRTAGPQASATDGAANGRIVAKTSQGAAAAAEKPAPIVIRLACVDAEAAMRSFKSPRGLREQLKGADATAPKPIPGKRCRPSAGLPLPATEAVAGVTAVANNVAGGQ